MTSTRLAHTIPQLTRPSKYTQDGGCLFIPSTNSMVKSEKDIRTCITLCITVTMLLKAININIYKYNI